MDSRIQNLTFRALHFLLASLFLSLRFLARRDNVSASTCEEWGSERPLVGVLVSPLVVVVELGGGGEGEGDWDIADI